MRAGWLCLGALLFLGAAHGEEDLYTNVYVVPPNFLNSGNSDDPADDPFANPAAERGEALKPRKTAKEILEIAGITFGQGTSAIYNPSTSQFIVRNTQDQMDLVEVYVESLVNKVEKQVYVKFREVVFDEKAIDEDETGFGWLAQVTETPETSVAFQNLEELLEELSRLPRGGKAAEGVRRGFSGVFTDPQVQMVYRTLEKNPDFEIEELPSVICRSGQPAMVQVNERRYEIVPVIGMDEFTMDLSVYLAPDGKALFEEGDPKSTPYKITIWDGQTVALAEKVEGGKSRVVFVRALMVDPAGFPIHEQVVPDDPDDSLEELEKRAGETEVPNRGGGEENPEPTAAHIVAKGETLFQVAKKHDVSIADLKEANKLEADVVEVGQLLLLPNRPVPGAETGQLFPTYDLATHLKSVVIDSVELRDVPFVDALALFQHELLHHENPRLPELRPQVILRGAEQSSDVQITLRLSNVPASEALRYLTALANCGYLLDGDRIIVTSKAN